MADVLSFCTVCFSQRHPSAACACGARAAGVLCPEGTEPLVVAQVHVLDDAAPADEWPAGACTGIRRDTPCSEETHWAAWWRHERQTLVFWRVGFDNLRNLGSDEASTKIRRAVSRARYLVVELPDATPLFAARYLRNQLPSERAPTAADVLDTLDDLRQYLLPELHAVAAYGTGTLTPEVHDRLRASSERVYVSASRAEAVRWLLSQLPANPHVPAVPLRVPTECDALRVLLQDVGGSVCRSALAGLHARTFEAVSQAGAEPTWPLRIARDGGSVLSTRIFASGMDEEGAHWGRLFLAYHADPPIGVLLPPWTGIERRIFRDDCAFRVELSEVDFPPTGPNPEPMIVGVGPVSLDGGRRFSRLLERVWSGEVWPCAVLCHPNADADLLRWVIEEFPDLRKCTFPAGWRGLRQSLSLSLAAARAGGLQ